MGAPSGHAAKRAASYSNTGFGYAFIMRKTISLCILYSQPNADKSSCEMSMAEKPS